ncbi:hypothetical protein [Hyphomicrobium sp. 2TAF46]|uniref:hypothetical protein n=1 Tax=Hyphomicrobium sp. 2TAF46 TaxID=3233019 RepID=UPI003F93ED64
MTKVSSSFIFIFTTVSLSLPVVAADLVPPLAGGVYEDVYLHNPPHTAGYVQGSYAGLVDAPYGATGDDWTVKGSINFNPERYVNLQADLGNSWKSSGALDAQVLSWAVHGYYRDRDFALGAFFQDANLHAGALGYLGDKNVRDYLGGLEGAYFLPNNTFYARVGYGKVEWSDYSPDHLMGVVGFRHYFTDNVRFDVEGDFNHLSYESAEADVRSVIVTGNYRPWAKPVTFFAGYRFDDADASISDYSFGLGGTGTVFGGVRLSFGSDSIKDEERSGPMWNVGL